MSQGTAFTLEDIPVSADEKNETASSYPSFDTDFETYLGRSEKSYFQHMLDCYNGNIAKIAEHSKITKKTVYAKMKLYSLKWKE